MIWHGTDKNKYNLEDLQKYHIILTRFVSRLFPARELIVFC